MWGLRELHRINEEAGQRNLKKGRGPHVISSLDEIDKMPPFPFPQLGCIQDPPGWKYNDVHWQCDKSGRGDSLSYGSDGLKRKIKEYLHEIHENDWCNYGFAIVEEGPFQLVIGVFEREVADGS